MQIPSTPKLAITAITAIVIAQSALAQQPAASARPEARYKQPLHGQKQPLLSDRLQWCSRVLDDRQRLRCFDATALSLSTPSSPAVAVPPPTADTTAARVGENTRADEHFVPEGRNSTATGNNTAAHAAEQQKPRQTVTAGLLDRLYSLRLTDEPDWFSIVPHRDIYVLPLWYSSQPQQRIATPSQQSVSLRANPPQPLEAAFQLSFKTRLLTLKGKGNMRLRLWLGYTQLAHWQLYNGAQSRPFRNTDYEPELFLTVPVDSGLPWGGRLRVAGVGLVHHSNGRSDPYSRSWNRIYAFAAAEWGSLSVQPRLWYRVEPGRSKDDNPDITDYMGHGDLRLAYRMSERSMFKGLLRYNPRQRKGAIQLGYAYRLGGKLRLYARLHSGYGANLLEYNHKNHAFGVGLMFNDWIGF